MWLHRRRGVFECDGRPVCADEHDIEVIAESTRLLSLKITVGRGFVSLSSLPTARMTQMEMNMFRSLNSLRCSYAERKELS